MSKALLETGATGKQGGAVVAAVLELPNASDYTILAVTRTATSLSATALAKRSPTIRLVEGILDDPGPQQLQPTQRSWVSSVSRFR
ncbi:MAG: hypothetical protein M1835_002699 [Candelina submexicana]|nr:MAG: hypothetical protein M1835_002699 [Candelina submexicana]